MTVIGIIPARYAATRFPGKVLAPIHGYPMVHHVYQRALACPLLDEVIIATDSPKVAMACAELKDRVMLTGTEHESGTDRVAEVARKLDADLIVNIQGDEPLLDPQIVQQLVDHMLTHEDLPMGTVGSTGLSPEASADRNVVKVVAEAGRAVAFYRSEPPALPKGDRLRHVGLYAYRSDFLERYAAQPRSPREQEEGLEQLRALDMGVPIGLVPVAYSGLAVDTPADLGKVMAIWEDFPSPQ